MKQVHSFNLNTHEREYNHFVSLFGSTYEYHFFSFNGVPFVDCIKIEK